MLHRDLLTHPDMPDSLKPRLKEVFEDYESALAVLGPESLIDKLMEAEDTKADILKEELALREEIRTIKQQLKAKKIGKKAPPKAREWHQKAKAALGIKGNQHQRLMSKVQEINNEIRDLRRLAHTEYTVKVAREIMTPEQWGEYKNRLAQQYASV